MTDKGLNICYLEFLLDLASSATGKGQSSSQKSSVIEEI